ncbi:MAG TPA: hypothetical protein DIV41_03110 [Ruminococcaceae bacterium]|nr:hypothetical protein [Oscillospiraceae bacterium]
MPNKFIFSDAKDSKTQMYGSNGGALTPLSVDGTGQMKMTVTDTLNVTVTNIPGVSVLNTPEVSIANTPGVSVLNTPEVSIANVPSVQVAGVAATSESVAVTTGTGAAHVLAEDTSKQREYSFYVSNLSETATMTLALQIAPADEDTYYVGDGATVALPPQSATVLVPLKYLSFTRLSYDTGTETANFIAYYNAKV